MLERFRYSTDEVLNLYKLFVEEIIDRYANETQEKFWVKNLEMHGRPHSSTGSLA